jgi:molybdopterin/thiamine biosynthesis adenylyltransferase
VNASPPDALPRRDEDDARWSRQERFHAIGQTGQRRIRDGRVLVVGVGALGTHVAELLARAGVGALWLVDRDVVELHNLQRQALFDEADARDGTPKAIAAARHLAAVASSVDVIPFVADYDADVHAALPGRPDVVVDGTDNFATRYRINDLAVRDGIPWVHGGVVGAVGNAFVVLPGRTPCLRCWLPDAAPAGELANCETVGVLAPAVTAVAGFQVMEVLKLLLGADTEVCTGAFTVNAWTHAHRVQMRDRRPDPTCETCGVHRYPALAEPPRRAVTLCGRDAVQIQPARRTTLDLVGLAARLDGVATNVDCRPQLLRFAAEGVRFTVFGDGRTLLFGVPSPERARILFDRYVGAD